MKKKERVIYSVVGGLLLLTLIIGSSFAWWTSTAEQSGINQITSTCLKVSLNEEKDAIHLEKAYPITDEEAQDLTPFTFKVENTCDTSINYTVNLGISDSSTLKEEYIAVQLNSNTKRILNSLKETTLEKYKKGYELATGILNGKESKQYSLKLWMDEHVTVEDEESMNKTFESKVVVNATLNTLAKVYTEDTLNGADPVLKDNLIPVKINETDGTVTKANIEEKWYDYSKKEWANAVILKDNGTIEEDGTIKEENIESYFVWIPKYKYKIFNMGEYNGLSQDEYQEKSQEIEIEFGIYDTVDNTIECTTPASGENGSCAVDKWMTPSAFTAFGTNGFWVGKFETGYDGVTSATEAMQHNELAAEKVIIKPNVYSWRNITVKNMFDTSYNYQIDLDSHMMKNTEWGAVAYLSHSKYGTCDGDKCVEVRINNNSAFVTGYAATEEPMTGLSAYRDYETPSGLGADGTKTINYKNSKSQVASTTGNYSGIYDMSGGSKEYTMGVIKGTNNTGFTFGSSGFSTSTFPFNNQEENSKYYDVYNYATNNLVFKNRILGDATGELGPFVHYNGNADRNVSSWHFDNAWFMFKNGPWLDRGSIKHNGVEAGIFAFCGEGGGEESNMGFRIVLAP